ncbi:hypothetical protein TRFO_30900 [Tritrichomonas foetus]|uniref:Uncharacterized protein n=1 Tax=Tritrichomonas foetus TaxID=1144522 RepID=A0A1J4JTQ7_9EUKA|nr:hypothetical protein TRFO_30900 [Tritrichomonas foetus]|eukprot:OHT02138.1 hypothetical protein TRFO_30900 [Tritrichomonas foetus]
MMRKGPTLLSTFPTLLPPDEVDGMNDDKSDQSDPDDFSQVPKSLTLPIPEIPFTRSQINSEFDRFTSVISKQREEIKDAHSFLISLREEAIEVIAERARLYSELIHINQSIKQSSQVVNPQIRKTVQDQTDECNQKLKATEEENSKIEQTIQENQKFSEQLQIKTQNVIKEHDELLSQLAASVPIETKHKIKLLNDQLEEQQKKAKVMSEQYNATLQEKDELITMLMKQLGDSGRQPSVQVIAKKEKIRRPALIKRDTTSENTDTENPNPNQLDSSYLLPPLKPLKDDEIQKLQDLGNENDNLLNDSEIENEDGDLGFGKIDISQFKQQDEPKDNDESSNNQNHKEEKIYTQESTKHKSSEKADKSEKDKKHHKKHNKGEKHKDEKHKKHEKKDENKKHHKKDDKRHKKDERKAKK